MTEVGVWSFQEFQGKIRLGRRRKEKGLKGRTDIGLHPTSVYGQKIESTSLWSVCKGWASLSWSLHYASRSLPHGYRIQAHKSPHIT